MSGDKKWRLHIIIDGNSASELFSVGVNDMKFFLKERLNVDSEDIKELAFLEDLTIDEYGEYLEGKRIKYKHKDNYIRKESENE